MSKLNNAYQLYIVLIFSISMVLQVLDFEEFVLYFEA